MASIFLRKRDLTEIRFSIQGSSLFPSLDIIGIMHVEYRKEKEIRAPLAGETLNLYKMSAIGSPFSSQSSDRYG